MPQPGNLSEAAATVESVKGTIRTSFQKSASGMVINVTVPTSAQAVVGIPASGVKSIKLNGKLVWKAGKYLKKNFSPSLNLPSDRIGFQVSSGEWKFDAE